MVGVMYQVNKQTKLIGLLASMLFTLLASGIFWAMTASDMRVSSAFAYVAGLVIAVTPCCLPLFFVITSLSIIQRRHRDALFVSASFAVGIALFAAILGMALALTGQLIGLPQISGVLFSIGGAIGYSYAMSELFGFHLPILGIRMSRINESRNSYATAFSTGLLLSMGDIGCPNPFRYVLLSFIAASGNLASGAALGFLYGLGAITPLILVALLAMLGINLSNAITRHPDKIERLVNLAFVPIGAFLITYGVFGEAWYESTIIHGSWESVLLQYGLIERHGHLGEESTLNIIGNVTLLLMTVAPLVTYLFRSHRRKLIRLE